MQNEMLSDNQRNTTPSSNRSLPIPQIVLEYNLSSTIPLLSHCLFTTKITNYLPLFFTERTLRRAVHKFSLSSNIATTSLLSSLSGHARHAAGHHCRLLLCHAHKHSLPEKKVRYHPRRVSTNSCRYIPIFLLTEECSISFLRNRKHVPCF